MKAVVTEMNGEVIEILIFNEFRVVFLGHFREDFTEQIVVNRVVGVDKSFIQVEIEGVIRFEMG